METFGITIDVCTAAGAPFEGRLSVDAGMPAHGHGMNNAAKVVQHEPGRFRAEGMLFHMPGEWELQLRLANDTGTGTQGLTYDIAVE